jgi:hypothetical protein
MYKLNVGNLVNIKNNKLKMHTVAHGCTPKNKKVSIYAVFRALCLVTGTKTKKPLRGFLFWYMIGLEAEG